MTAYNRATLISRSIESVISSTYRNWELIIVDDASTDETAMVANTFADREPRIRVVINPGNLGDYPNRNRAAEFANGKYMIYVDSDDVIFPGSIETMVKKMEQFPEAGFGLSVVGDTFNFNDKPLLNGADAYRMHYNVNPIFFASPGNAIFKRVAFMEVGGFRTFRMVSDFDMWHRMSARYPLVLLPSNLYQYNVHGEQEIKDFANYLVQYEQIKINYLLASDSPLKIKESKRIIDRRRTNLFKIIVGFIFTGKWRSAGYRMKVLAFYLKNGYRRNEL